MDLKTLLKECPEEILDKMKTLKVEKGSVLLAQGDQPSQVLFLVEGKINVYRLAVNGINYLEYQYTNDDMIGEIEAINGMEMLTNVVAATTCLIKSIDIDTFKLWMTIDKMFSSYVLEQLADKLYEACLNSEVNIVYPLKYKVLYYIISQAEQGNKYIQKDNLVAAVAGRLRSVNRIFKDLEDEGIIEQDMGMIKVLDLEAIKEDMSSFERQ